VARRSCRATRRRSPTPSSWCALPAAYPSSPTPGAATGAHRRRARRPAAARPGRIEVDHQDHDPAAREELRRIARDLGLVATGSSDWHGTGKVDHQLGCNTTDPEAFERLLAAAGVAATDLVAP
jgi:hypothetical protein